MKTAQEMFEDLGFEREVYDSVIMGENFIGYMNKKENKYIGFRRWLKDFHAYEGDDTMDIDMSTFSAIYQQVKELGWLKE